MEPVRLVTDRVQTERRVKKLLISCARQSPEAAVVVYVRDSRVHIGCAGMHRLEIMGALHAALQEIWMANE